MDTFWNKMVALGLIACVAILYFLRILVDGAGLIIILLIAVPLFFADENWIV